MLIVAGATAAALSVLFGSMRSVEQPQRTDLWTGVRFTEDEARSILAQIDRVAFRDAARRARWERIGSAREALAAAGSPTALSR